MPSDLLETVFVVNPELVLRTDMKRAILFHEDPLGCVRNPFTKLLSPRTAIFLSLFDGVADLRSVVKMWAGLTERDVAAAAGDAIAILETCSDLEVDILIPRTAVASGSFRTYNPADFTVAPPESVDLSPTRCFMPTSFTHEVCYRCVTSCRYCYSDLRERQGDLLALDRLAEIVDEASSRLSIRTVAMSGGDPFCHPHIFEVLQIYGDAGVRIDVPTKTPLRRSQIERLRTMPWVRLQFSLDCIDEPVNDWLVGVPGHTRRMLETLQLTKELGLRFSCNSVLTAFNYREGMALIPFLMDNFGDQVRRISVTPYGQSIYRHDPSLNLPDFAIREVEKSVSAFKERYPGPQITFSGGVAQPVDDSLDERRRRYRSRAQCTANRNAFILLPDGQVTVCEELYYHPAFLIGDLRRQSIMEMWQSEAALALVNPQRADVPDGACALCPDFDECNTGLGRCYKKTLQAYGYDRPHWPDPSCPYAPPAGAG